jgi:hypothetical protein
METFNTHNEIFPKKFTRSGNPKRTSVRVATHILTGRLPNTCTFQKRCLIFDPCCSILQKGNHEIRKDHKSMAFYIKQIYLPQIAQLVQWRVYNLDDRIQTGSGVHPASYAMGTGGSFRGVKLTTHLHIMPRLRMRGAIPPLPQYVFMALALS